MIDFDYAEAEATDDGGWDIQVGLKFADEPDELYVARIRKSPEGAMAEPVLYFNGMDCRYEWRQGEQEALFQYIESEWLKIGKGDKG